MKIIELGTKTIMTERMLPVDWWQEAADQACELRNYQPLSKSIVSTLSSPPFGMTYFGDAAGAFVIAVRGGDCCGRRSRTGPLSASEPTLSKSELSSVTGVDSLSIDSKQLTEARTPRLRDWFIRLEGEVLVARRHSKSRRGCPGWNSHTTVDPIGGQLCLESRLQTRLSGGPDKLSRKRSKILPVYCCKHSTYSTVQDEQIRTLARHHAPKPDGGRRPSERNLPRGCRHPSQ